MKNKVTATFVLLCIVAAFLLPSGQTAGTVYFSAINNTVLPLNDATMPRFYNGQIYLPYSFFNSDELGVYSNADSNTAVIYNAAKTLTFDVAKGSSVDQDGLQYFQYSARSYSGIVFVPARFVCDFFGFMSPTVIEAQPASIIRVRTDANTVNDPTFPNVGFIKTQLKSAYDKYIGTPSSTASPNPSENVEPTYPGVSVYLSFYELPPDRMKNILDALASTSYKVCFFVEADEIAANADLIRRAVCKGHTIGIWLTGGTKEGAYKDYQETSALLFEAAQVKTVIVAALGDNVKTAEEMAGEKSLVFWRPTRSYDAAAKFSVNSLTSKLGTIGGVRDSLYFACSDETAVVLPAFLSYLSQYDYNVKRVTETSIPIISA